MEENKQPDNNDQEHKKPVTQVNKPVVKRVTTPRKTAVTKATTSINPEPVATEAATALSDDGAPETLDETEEDNKKLDKKNLKKLKKMSDKIKEKEKKAKEKQKEKEKKAKKKKKEKAKKEKAKKKIKEKKAKKKAAAKKRKSKKK